MGSMASQTTSLTVVYSTVYSGADQRKNQSFASLAFVRVIHRGPVNFPRKWPVTRKMFPFDDVIMGYLLLDHHHQPTDDHQVKHHEINMGFGTSALRTSSMCISDPMPAISLLVCTLASNATM